MYCMYIATIVTLYTLIDENWFLGRNWVIYTVHKQVFFLVTLDYEKLRKRNVMLYKRTATPKNDNGERALMRHTCEVEIYVVRVGAAVSRVNQILFI